MNNVGNDVNTICEKKLKTIFFKKNTKTKLNDIKLWKLKTNCYENIKTKNIYFFNILLSLNMFGIKNRIENLQLGKRWDGKLYGTGDLSNYD